MKVNVFEVLKTKLKRIISFIKKHPFKSLFYLIASVCSFAILLVLFTYVGVFGKLPTKDFLLQLKTPLTSTLYASNKEQIGFYYLQNRSNIDSTEIPKALKDALIATEDSRFYEHNGIDYKSYGRVFIKSVILRQNAGGGSTLTQQVAKNTFGRKSHFLLSTPINKIKEIFIARKLEKIYTKDEILLLYLNTVTFGENIYGIEKAAFRFFNKPPAKLSIGECATLVGLLKAPTFYNPRKHPERATTRRNVVLQQMVKYNYLSINEQQKAQKPLKLNYQEPKKLSSLNSYFKEYINSEFNAWAKENPAEDGHIYNLETDGLKIYSTLNSSVQKSSEKAMLRQMVNLQKLMDLHWEALSTEGGKEELLRKLLNQTNDVKKWKSQGKSDVEIEQLSSEKKPRKHYTLNLGNEQKLQSLKDSIATAINRLHTGLLTINSQTGRILGYVAGIDYGMSQKDNILEKKQVGSTFKPITYLAALEKGKNPCDFYNNSLITYKNYENWQPKNSSGNYGGSYSMHGALANSINTVSVRLQMEVGIEPVQKLAEKMGVTATLPKVPSIVLGTGSISLFDMVTAYASISNGGKRIKPYAIERIEDENGVVLYQAKPTYTNRVASEKNIKKLQQMMGTALTDGTASRIQNYAIPFNLIGKTGTTQNNGDGWFIACSPEIVVGSWVGTFDKRVQFKSTNMGSGANTALPMVAAIFKDLSLWNKTMLTNFEYEKPYFDCPPFLEINAAEAMEYIKTDSTFINQRKIKDSIFESSKILIDSIQENP
ncbi:transglycosylase domain-containing protein [Polaribacter sp. Hel_I_88]|uniref:transglycosylase domain-containing protein n=1 Tax=Polaribacter sp. Hel_I_88 TaxID=1250006 RepID=UPI000561FAE8|nr:transglycosylase domain-containing protein [Polaribacter sp. Hel_I_88]